MTTSFTGEEFAKALCEGRLKDPIVKVGMVKKDERGSILFAPASCSDWIKVPVESIDEVTYLGRSTCRDHEHPLVQIRFKEPGADHEGARLFAELARLSPQPHAAGPAEEPPSAPPANMSRSSLGGVFGGSGGFYGKIPGCWCKQFEYHCREVMVGVKGHPEIQVPTWVCEWVCSRYECPERT